MNPSLYEPACGLSCPDESYSLNEWHSVILITRIGAGISVACMIILIGVYLLSKERRQFPFTLHLNQFVATFFFCASFLIGGLHAEQTVWCDDKGTNATQSSNIWCAIQGTCFIFFGSAITSWSTSNAYVVYYIVVMQRYNPEATKLLKKNVYRFYLFSWGIPLIFTIAAITTKKIGYGPPLAWCFMDFTAFTSGVLSPDYILFYLPNVAKLILSSIMFCRSLAVIILMRRTHRKYSTPNADQKLFSVQIRCLVFIVVNFIICFTLFEWRIKIQLDNKNRQVGLSWIYCKIATQLIKGYTGDCPGSVNPARINYPHTIFESVLLSGIGVLIFMAFGSDLNLLSYLLSVSSSPPTTPPTPFFCVCLFTFLFYSSTALRYPFFPAFLIFYVFFLLGTFPLFHVFSFSLSQISFFFHLSFLVSRFSFLVSRFSVTVSRVSLFIGSPFLVSAF
eukprot:Phypoly_transcript_08269.p1 GENE.Phypoly_transcript_08269~~Phypoly_transcript_08269.p1  ORF type:complete len:481 (+),score=24.34 Phypoly_transcript_08269:99-1445(+)